MIFASGQEGRGEQFDFCGIMISKGAGRPGGGPYIAHISLGRFDG